MTHPAEDHDHVEEPTVEELRMTRRSMLTLLGAAGLAVVAGCATDAATATTTTLLPTTPSTNGGTSSTSGGTTTASPSTTAGATTTTTGTCVLIPEETEGPYPLDLSGEEEFFRSAVAEDRPGLPFSLTLTLVDVPGGCVPIEGARVDLWHCDAEGVYSGYQQPGVDTTGETFCRGIQLTDAAGRVTFDTIFPGWYPGRVTHFHFQVFLEGGLAATSQIAFPDDVVEAVYTQVAPYSSKGPNTSVPSLAQDNIFADGSAYQMLSLTGDTTSGYAGSLMVGIAA